MKEIFKKIIIGILTIEAKITLKRFKPKIIAISGSVGKTTTKDAIFAALRDVFYIRKNQKSLNSEIGVPLTILGLDTAWSSPLGWIKNVIKGALVPFSRKYPEWLVLEVGSDHPGDISNIGKWLQPDVAVLTSFPKVPVHSEFFNSPNDVNEEDRQIANFVKREGVIILNQDDEEVMKTKDMAKRGIYTFGSNDDADIYFSNQDVTYSDIDDIKIPTGISMKVNVEGNSMPVNIRGVLGEQHMYPIVAALSVGFSQKVSIVSMIASLQKYKAPKGRMNIISGINNTVIIDDTYNSSPIAVNKALETLNNLDTQGKKIVVLGDMLELGRHSVSEHKKVGELVASLKMDYLLTVGIRSEDIAGEAIKEGMNKDKIFKFNDNKEVASRLKDILSKGDFVLIKGSQGIRLEKVVEDIMSNPEERKELLARQDKAWVGR